MRYIALFLLLVLSVLGGALTGAQSANAASTYDNVIDTIDELTIDTGYTSGPCTTISPYNATYNWSEAMLTQNFTTSTLHEFSDETPMYWSSVNSTMKDNWDNKTYWGVLKLSPTIYQVYFTNDPNAELQFADKYGTQLLTLTVDSPYIISIYQVELTQWDSFTCALKHDIGSASTTTFDLSPSTWGAQVLFLNTPINYPSGYDGQIPPDTVELPTPQTTPSFGWTVNDKKLYITHWEQNTDLPYNLANPGYEWNFKLYTTGSDYDKDTGQLVDNKNTNLQGHYIYDGLTVGYYYAEVTLVSTPPAVNRDDIAPVSFKINYIGQFQSGSTDNLTCTDNICEAPPIYSLESCFTETFPWVDIEACSADAKGLIYLLSFKTVTFGDQRFTTSQGCETLTVLHTWIHLEDPEICPNFSETVRNIVTPFITFLLGLLTMKFLTRNEGYLQ